VNCRFHLLDLDYLLTVEDTSLRLVATLPGTVSSSAIASDGTQLVLAWSTGGDERRRVLLGGR
jgi:hypothetical protein